MERSGSKPERPEKTAEVHDDNVCTMVQKNGFTKETANTTQQLLEAQKCEMQDKTDGRHPKQAAAEGAAVTTCRASLGGNSICPRAPDFITDCKGFYFTLSNYV